MWKSGTFDLEDINKALIDEIVFFDIFYSAMGDSGCVIFFTRRGDEYIISESGTEWDVKDIIELFPELYEVYWREEYGILDEYGFKNVGNWKVIPAVCGELLVRNDYFKRFYDEYKLVDEMCRDFPLGIIRNMFGKEMLAPDERVVYIKTQEYWDKVRQWEDAREKERVANRLSVEEIPWIKYYDVMGDGHIRFWIRKNDDVTFSGYRWLVQEQKEQFKEGSTRVNARVECYNLFLQKYENIDVQKINDIEKLYCDYVKNSKVGKFVRSYENLEKAKEAVCIRNEWIGWGNVNKKNVYKIDYEYLKTKIEADSQICIF